jgi:hypothetical protein
MRCPGLYKCSKYAKLADSGLPCCAALLRVDVIAGIKLLFSSGAQFKPLIDADKPTTARIFRAHRHGSAFEPPSENAIDAQFSIDAGRWIVFVRWTDSRRLFRSFRVRRSCSHRLLTATRAQQSRANRSTMETMTGHTYTHTHTHTSARIYSLL